MNKIEIPSEIKYRILETNGVFQPQYKKRNKWVNSTYTYWDPRDGEATECNKRFNNIEEAENYINNLIKNNIKTIHYKDNWI
jgi:hypothetical protein